MDSSLCVLKGLIGMLETGMYGRVFVKKFINRKTVIYGYEINAHCFKIIEHYCPLLHLKGVNFDVFLKRSKLQHYNHVYKIWAHGS